MGDSWEDWDTEEVAVPGINGAAAVDPKKFEDEDAEEEEPKWKAAIPVTQAGSCSRSNSNKSFI